MLAACSSTALITVPRGRAPTALAPAGSTNESIAEWDDDRNGRVSYAEAPTHGIAPMTRDHPAYPFMRDGDGDGVVCDSGSASPRVPRRRRRRPRRAGGDRTATARNSGAITPTASPGATLHTSGVWT